jgi:H+/Cl- antiporter ClcA/CBS domain-containing protein
MAKRDRSKPSDAVIGTDFRTTAGGERKLGDFTTPASLLKLVPLTLLVGIAGAFVALLLVWMIGFLTNVLYYQRIDFHLTSPLDNTLGALGILIPVLGGVLVGLMARYGSERIRGHGIPEAMETILVGGSKVEPRLTVLKPLSSAISIGTGGPFGAEGPIILTGGALGSVIAQFVRLSAIDRRCLLVAGAAAGMSAIFGTPIAAVLLGVELLLFEWKPRSMILAGIASGVADAVRHWFVYRGWMHPEPLFPVPSAHFTGMWAGLLDATILGIAGGLCAWLLTKAVYGAEDAFKKLPIHWVWWPAIGGLLIGVGGLIEPRSLGVGYDTIRAELAGSLALGTLISLFVVKLLIWAIGLGSGTSGGILAPIIMMGAAIGGMLGLVLPGGTAADWAVLGVVGALSGVTRSPFTSMVFAVELTHDMDLFLPLLVTATIAYLISVLILKRSILTEKVARRGFHVLREYTVDSLDVVFAREVMATQVLNLHPGLTLPEVEALLQQSSKMRYQRLLPVVDEQDRLLGVVPWQDVVERAISGNLEGKVEDIMRTAVVVTYPDESLRGVADLMATHNVGVLPVVERASPHRLLGLITQYNLLRAHERMLVEERKREQVLHLSFPGRFSRSRRQPSHPSDRPEEGADHSAAGAASPLNGSARVPPEKQKPPLSEKPDKGEEPGNTAAPDES